MESPRLLTTHDRAALEAFECAIYREDWTRQPELLIRGFLPDGIADGTSRGLGIWEDGQLVGVAAWSEQGSHLVWRVSVLAVATG